ncbi:somatostatin receptor type 5-like [Glandiceps talaboti]
MGNDSYVGEDSFPAFGNTSDQEPSITTPYWFSAFLIPCLQIAICVGGLVGNGIVLYVLLRCTELKTAPDVYILNLTSADLLFMLTMPFLTYQSTNGKWDLGDAMCKIVFSIDGMNLFTGIFILTAMSVDRYLAVVHAIWSIRYRTVKVAKIICGILWLTSVMLTVPLWIFLKTVDYGDDEGIFCMVTWVEKGDIYMVGTFVIGFAGPLLVISMCYIQILLFLARGTRPGKDRRRKSKLGRVGLIVILAVVIFTVCWLPFWVTQILLIMPGFVLTSTYSTVWSLGSCFQYLNSALNPLVYTCVRDDFRQHLTRLCCGKQYVEASRERRMSKLMTTKGGCRGNSHCSQTMYQVDDTGKTTTTMVNLNSCSQL